MKQCQKKRKSGRTLRFFGLLFLLYAAVLTGVNARENRQAGKHSEEILQKVREQTQKEPEPVQSIVLKESSEKKEEAFPKGILAILEIPEKELTLPVFDTYSEELLKQSVCRYGEEECKEGQLIIAGHNYEKHFRRVRTMKAGDKLTLEFPKKIQSYTVSEVVEINGMDKEGLFSGEWDLSLFTCSFNRKRRMVVRCIED